MHHLLFNCGLGHSYFFYLLLQDVRFQHLVPEFLERVSFGWDVSGHGSADIAVS